MKLYPKLLILLAMTSLALINIILPYNNHSSLSTRSLPVVPKLMPSTLISARPLILYLTTLHCGPQVLQADFDRGSIHTYQTDPSMLSLTINLQVYFLCSCAVRCPARTPDSTGSLAQQTSKSEPGPLLFLIYITDIFHINIYSSILYLLLQITPSALDQA